MLWFSPADGTREEDYRSTKSQSFLMRNSNVAFASGLPVSLQMTGDPAVSIRAASQRLPV
jgi:hypothetical protein